MDTTHRLSVYSTGTQSSWSAGWSFLGFADSVQEALVKWPHATSILQYAGEPNQRCVWSNGQLHIPELQ